MFHFAIFVFDWPLIEKDVRYAIFCPFNRETFIERDSDGWLAIGSLSCSFALHVRNSLAKRLRDGMPQKKHISTYIIDILGIQTMIYLTWSYRMDSICFGMHVGCRIIYGILFWMFNITITLHLLIIRGFICINNMSSSHWLLLAIQQLLLYRWYCRWCVLLSESSLIGLIVYSFVLSLILLDHLISLLHFYSSLFCDY